MKKLYKSLLAFMFVLFLSVGTAACGKKDNPEGNENKAEEPADTSVTAAQLKQVINYVSAAKGYNFNGTVAANITIHEEEEQATFDANFAIDGYVYVVEAAEQDAEDEHTVYATIAANLTRDTGNEEDDGEMSLYLKLYITDDALYVAFGGENPTTHEIQYGDWAQIDMDYLTGMAGMFLGNDDYEDDNDLYNGSDEEENEDLYEDHEEENEDFNEEQEDNDDIDEPYYPDEEEGFGFFGTIMSVLGNGELKSLLAVNEDKMLENIASLSKDLLTLSKEGKLLTLKVEDNYKDLANGLITTYITAINEEKSVYDTINSLVTVVNNKYKVFKVNEGSTFVDTLAKDIKGVLYNADGTAKKVSDLVAWIDGIFADAGLELTVEKLANLVTNPVLISSFADSLDDSSDMKTYIETIIATVPEGETIWSSYYASFKDVPLDMIFSLIQSFTSQSKETPEQEQQPPTAEVEEEQPAITFYNFVDFGVNMLKQVKVTDLMGELDTEDWPVDANNKLVAPQVSALNYTVELKVNEDTGLTGLNVDVTAGGSFDDLSFSATIEASCTFTAISTKPAAPTGLPVAQAELAE